MLQCVSLAGSLSLKSKGFTQKSYSCACIGYRLKKTLFGIGKIVNLSGTVNYIDRNLLTLNFDEEKMCGHLLTCLAKSFPKKEKCSYNTPTPKLVIINMSYARVFC